jgi:hypothetical protein
MSSDDSAGGPSRPVLLAPHTPRCMGCGPDNPHGFKMTVYRCGDEVFSGVVADIWLANLTAWIRQRTTTDEAGQPLADAIRLLLADDSDDPVN